MTRTRPTAGQVIYFGTIARSDEPLEDLHRQQDGEPAGELTEFWLPVTLAIVAVAEAVGVLILIGVLPV